MIFSFDHMTGENREQAHSTTTLSCSSNDGMSKENLHFDDQCKQVCKLDFSFFSDRFSKIKYKKHNFPISIPIDLKNYTHASLAELEKTACGNTCLST